jgi:hypothetical protein
MLIKQANQLILLRCAMGGHVHGLEFPEPFGMLPNGTSGASTEKINKNSAFSARYT